MHSDHFTIPDHTGCLITLSDRNGPSCPSLSDFDYILDLLSADFDFKFRCTLILSVLGPFTRPSMSLQPILTLYFGALGPFRTRTLFPPLHVLQLGRDNFDVLGHFPPNLHALMHFKFRCTGTLPRILNVLMHSDPFPAPSIKSGNTIMSQRKICVNDI